MITETTTPILSVIIPVYNTGNYLIRCLDSIINQNLKKIEIIISNDMSTDDSEEISLNYVKRYDFIKYFKMTSKGFAGGARNLGLVHASGKYIGFVDSDDWIDATMYEKMINLIEKSCADIAVCGVITEHDNACEAVKRYEYKCENIIAGQLALALLARQPNQDVSISAIVCNKIYRKQFLKKNECAFLIDNYNDDDVFNFLCFLKATKVVLTPDTYYHYYQRQHSVMHSFSKKHIDDFIDAFGIIKYNLEEINGFDLHKKNYYAFFEKCLLSLGIPSFMRQNRAKRLISD